MAEPPNRRVKSRLIFDILSLTTKHMKFRIFISSVQREFARERRQLAEYIRKDLVFSKFFDVFLFEEIPAGDASPKAVYLKEVAKSDVYIGLVGREYGFEDDAGVSPTEREYDCAGEHNKPRFVFVKKSEVRNPKEQRFLEKVESERVRKTFPNLKSLKDAVAATLVRFLEERRKIQTGPFDSSVCEGASLKDLSTVKMRDFIRVARERRGFKLPVSTSANDLLAHLDLMREDGRLTNAAVLLFGKKPQRYFINSEVKCAWFYGTRVEKPMADHQIYQGDVFQLADQARDFVMSHISREIGRHNGPDGSAPTRYELPLDAVFELIVNAICHRDYTSHESVQVMLFKDRLEIWNAGSLPRGWTVKNLFRPHTSLPPNELLAKPMYLKGYIEKTGTGTGDVIDYCRQWELPPPEFVEESDFRVILRRKTTTEPTEETSLRTTRKTTGKTTGKNQEFEARGALEKIRGLIVMNPRITIPEIARQLRLTEDGVFYHIRTLRAVAGLRREGGRKFGHWAFEEK